MHAIRRGWLSLEWLAGASVLSYEGAMMLPVVLTAVAVYTRPADRPLRSVIAPLLPVAAV